MPKSVIGIALGIALSGSLLWAQEAPAPCSLGWICFTTVRGETGMVRAAEMAALSTTWVTGPGPNAAAPLGEGEALTPLDQGRTGRFRSDSAVRSRRPILQGRPYL
jgi:hypothetical protein